MTLYSNQGLKSSSSWFFLEVNLGVLKTTSTENLGLRKGTELKARHFSNGGI